MIYDCIIVGAGAAGLFCAASAGFRINGLILEKTKRAGTKLLMSGSGQCNITHSGSIKDFIGRYGKNGSRIRSCLYKYNNLHLQDFLRRNGIDTVTREDGKVFPKSMNARDILNMLRHQASENGFQIQCSCEVTRITRCESENCWCAETENKAFFCRNLIIASGGCSYPSTGSDGKLFSVLKRDLDVPVISPSPALTPVFVENYPYGQLSGISFPNAGLQLHQKPCTGNSGVTDSAPSDSASDGGDSLSGNSPGCNNIKTGASAKETGTVPFRKTASYTGPLLLTSENFSGPLVLNSSRNFRTGDRIVFNYLYPMKKEEALSRIISAAKGTGTQLSNLIPKIFHIPKSFAAAIISQTGDKPKAIAARLTEDTFTVSSLGGFHKAMATAGGIPLSEINAGTMECKKHHSLYFIGEMLDIDGETGGYNLQFAYSSACAAINSVCDSLSE